MVGAATELAVTQLGRYRILKHLASGGMAEVFLATATGIEGFERHVVIKQIHKQHAKHPGFVQMFLDEARLAAALHHHNVVQVHDIGQADGEYFYAMEYVHGEDLRALLMRVSKRKQVVPLEHVVQIVNAAGAGLHYAHELRGSDRRPLQLVHRDVSPSNIIVDYDGNVKVVDFGIAKAAMKSEQTRSGVLKGKVSYMSPEQCRGKAVDRRSDIYALGIVLYELATARRLFKGENDFMTMSTIVAGKVPPPSTRRPDIPPELEGIIMKALAKEPEDRFQTVQEMRVALDQFAVHFGLRMSSTGLAAYMEEVFGGRRIEPWLVEGLYQPEDLTEDFDGSKEGLARVSHSAVSEFVANDSSVPDSSPLIKAQHKAGASGLEDAIQEDPRRSNVLSAPDSAVFNMARSTTHSGVGSSPAHKSGTPMAWPTGPEQKRGRGWVIVLVALPLIGAGIAMGPRLIAMTSDDEPASTSAAQPTAPAPTPPPVTPAPAEPAPPAPVEPVEPAPPAPTPTPTHAVTETQPAATETAKKPKRATKTTKKTKQSTQPANKTPTNKPAPGDADWNPDELLPD
jgi:eukaryotic-like serine/threonine-protein kinase